VPHRSSIRSALLTLRLCVVAAAAGPRRRRPHDPAARSGGPVPAAADERSGATSAPDADDWATVRAAADGQTVRRWRAQPLFGNGQVDVAMSYNPSIVQTAVRRQGTFPATVRAFVLDHGTLQNVSYVTIPVTADSRAGALVVANMLLDPALQASKADPDVLGVLTVLDPDRVSVSAGRLVAAGATLPVTAPDGPATAVVLPEHLHLSTDGPLRGRCPARTFQGTHTQLLVDCAGATIEAHVDPDTTVTVGDKVWLAVAARHVRVLPEPANHMSCDGSWAPPS
jgi:hypothetical protein